MKSIFALFFLCLSAVSLLAQKPDEVLATATGLTFTQSSLSENGRKIYLGQAKILSSERTRLLSQMVDGLLLESEAKSSGAASDSLIAAELKKIAKPTEAEIKAVFDANKANFGEQTIDAVRPQIVAFLRQNAEQKTFRDLIERLKLKYKFAAGKDINAADLKPLESIFSINGKSTSSAEFDERYKAAIYDMRGEIADEIIADLENTIFSTLVNQEAKARSIEAGDVIAVEITNKMREFSDEERAELEGAFRTKLFTKFNVKIIVREPEPVAHNISVDDDPTTGKPTAAVTVIMFSDFQCSACGATHPILKKVIAEYGDKVRFVVRDFPLESVHENAFRSALAANAARVQGKFFEYIDVLYSNQESLDEASLKKYAVELGLNIKQFELDFSSEKTAAEVRKDMADGKHYGVGSTPTIYVNGVKVRRLSAENFRNVIGRALAKSATK
ncbi:MAG: thioredoxin domain-containing protein [Pyrinomonadaceae bacterium]